MSELHSKFGQLLRLERERRQIPLDKVSEQLKISETNLASIENGRPDELPAELYYNLFAKSYAEYLGIDFSKTFEAMEQDLEEQSSSNSKKGDQATDGGDAESGDSEAEPKEESFFSKKVIAFGTAIPAGFVIFIVIYQIFWGGNGSSADQPGSENSSTPQQTAAEAQDAELANYNWDVPTYASPDSLRLTLSARDASWSTVLADGDTAIYRNLNPERRYQVAAKYRLLVSVGIPRLVDIELNGRPVYLASPTTGRISRVEINQTNRDKFLERPVPVSVPSPAANVARAPATNADTQTTDTLGRDTIPPEGI